MKEITFDQYKDEVFASDPEIKLLYEQELLNYTIGNEVRKIRLARGWSQQELATKMQTTQSVIARIEGGRSNISLKTLGRLTSSLGAQIHLTL